jgi:primosomal protein N'
LQPIVELRSDVPALPPDVLELAQFVAAYYQEPLGLALAQMLPPLAAKSRQTERTKRRIVRRQRSTRRRGAVRPACP